MLQGRECDPSTSRIEGLAPPGGVAVSAMVHDNVGSRLDLAFEDMGEQTVKNLAKPIRVFRVADAAAIARRAPEIARMGPILRYGLDGAITIACRLEAANACASAGLGKAWAAPANSTDWMIGRHR